MFRLFINAIISKKPEQVVSYCKNIILLQINLRRLSENMFLNHFRKHNGMTHTKSSTEDGLSLNSSRIVRLQSSL
jgi:hypothetical protein